MGAPIPSGGYPSRTEHIQALVRQGLKCSEIATIVGISEKNVANLKYCASLKRRWPRVTEGMGQTLVVSREIAIALNPHAARRGITWNELARRLLDEIVDGAMVDAVLDDRDDTGACLETPPRRTR